MPWWWFLVMTIIIGMVVFQLWRNVQQRRWDSQQPLHSLWVTVSKRDEIPITRPGKENEDLHTRYRYFLEFTPLEGGESRRFQVKRKQFDQLTQDLEGELTIQGSRLVSFEAGQASAQDSEGQ
ncbi:DUF2500 domain-containing protein [Agarivorans sp. 1_MG-2023]|uniref:DUF2500 domain-containing protein n=1 Tax=Agarivorans sp. 1_MG-2023 TaxID=3062634 RepID=UPI0026E1231E|nr:DUF2500 domain-containing protein [Agarivorans sp. 1_MG-2023]MDO6764907.1 DUF2500 domain-containing protein [Agarivorans sp. 1_MG-2023]